MALKGFHVSLKMFQGSWFEWSLRMFQIALKCLKKSSKSWRFVHDPEVLEKVLEEVQMILEDIPGHLEEVPWDLEELQNSLKWFQDL